MSKLLPRFDRQGSADESERRLDPYIEHYVPHGARVLDLGCGSGELLLRLIGSRGIQARGVEIQADNFKKCIEKGLAVYQGDLDDGLDDFEAGILDVVILNLTLSMLYHPDEILRDIVRIGQRAIVSFYNAAWLPRRWHFLLDGEIDAILPGEEAWDQSSHIRPFSVADFERLCTREGIRIADRTWVDAKLEPLSGLFSHWPHDWAYAAVYLLERDG